VIGESRKATCNRNGSQLSIDHRNKDVLVETLRRIVMPKVRRESLALGVNLPQLSAVESRVHVLGSRSRVQQFDGGRGLKEPDDQLFRLEGEQYDKSFGAAIIQPEVVGLGDLYFIAGFEVQLHSRFFDSIE